MGQKFARLDPARCGAVHAGNQCRLAVLGTGQHDHRITELLLQAVHRLTQALGIDAFQACSQDPDALDLDRGRRQGRPPRCWRPWT